VRCALGTIRPGQVVTAHARVRVLVPGELHSLLYTSSQTPESNLTNNSSIADLTSTPRTQRVNVHVTAPPAGRVGSAFSYRVTVRPRGKHAVHGVRLCTRFPRTFIQRQAAGTFRYHGMRCRDYLTLARPRGFTVRAVPAAGGRVTLPAIAAIVGSRRRARDNDHASISVVGCGARAASRNDEGPIAHIAC
jgi:hypothetical protein